MWSYKTPGIPDPEFFREEGIPITKEEVRVVQISKARLKRGVTAYDIGCGSGSITVEVALQVEKEGMVYAVDRDPRAVDLTRRNLEKFNVNNVSVVQASAMDAIPDLPHADAIFIGGTGAETEEIIELCRDKLRPGGRIVVGIILIETLYSAIKALECTGFSSIEVTQVAVSKGRKTSTGTMMLARNPVAIVAASVEGAGGRTA